MSKDENAKESILNYVENFIDKRDNELRAASGDEVSAPGTPKISRESIVIKSNDTDFPSETLVNQFNFLFYLFVDFYRAVERQRLRTLKVQNSISMRIQLLKQKKVAKKFTNNKFIYDNINRRHQIQSIFKFEKLWSNRLYNDHRFMSTLGPINNENNNVHHRLFSLKVHHLNRHQ